MAQNRTNRDLVSREKETRYVYKPSSTLPDPTPEPGYTYRWIATHILGQEDLPNTTRKFRDGWEAVKVADHPELMLSGKDATGNVEIGGLLLCKINTEKLTAMKEYFEGKANDQMDSVDNHFMRNNDPRMPLFSERKSTTSRGQGFGSGSK
jgi:hypothetical protein